MWSGPYLPPRPHLMTASPSICKVNFEIKLQPENFGFSCLFPSPSSSFSVDHYSIGRKPFLTFASISGTLGWVVVVFFSQNVRTLCTEWLSHLSTCWETNGKICLGLQKVKGRTEVILTA